MKEPKYEMEKYDTGYKSIVKLGGGIQWYMLETKNFSSTKKFELRK